MPTSTSPTNKPYSIYGVRGGRFTTADSGSSSSKHTYIEDAERLGQQTPGPGAYSVEQSYSAVQGNKGSRFSATPVKTDVDWQIARSSVIPGPGDYTLSTSPKPEGGRFNPVKAKTALEWQMLYASRLPGPGEYEWESKQVQLPIGGRFSLANALNEEDLKIMHASELPGPGAYELVKPMATKGGQFSTAFPKTNLDWEIYRAKQIPGPLDYCDWAVKPSKIEGGRISSAVVKNDVEWHIYNKRAIPGPGQYHTDIFSISARCGTSGSQTARERSNRNGSSTPRTSGSSTFRSLSSSRDFSRDTTNRPTTTSESLDLQTASMSTSTCGVSSQQSTPLRPARSPPRAVSSTATVSRPQMLRRGAGRVSSGPTTSVLPPGGPSPPSGSGGNHTPLQRRVQLQRAWSAPQNKPIRKQYASASTSTSNGSSATEASTGKDMVFTDRDTGESKGKGRVPVDKAGTRSMASKAGMAATAQQQALRNVFSGPSSIAAAASVYAPPSRRHRDPLPSSPTTKDGPKPPKVRWSPDVGAEEVQS